MAALNVSSLLRLEGRRLVFRKVNDAFVRNRDKEDQKKDLQRRDPGTGAKKPFAQTPPWGSMQPVAALAALPGGAQVGVPASTAGDVGASAALRAEVRSGRIEFTAFGAMNSGLRLSGHRMASVGWQVFIRVGFVTRVMNQY